MRRPLYTILMAILLMGLFPPVVRAAEGSPRVLVDGIVLKTDVAPRIVDNRTLVPFRAIGEALGVKVTWIGESATVLAEGDGRSLRLVIGQHGAFVNGQAAWLDVPPQIVSGRTLVPARVFAEAFGAAVSWDEVTGTVLIQSAVRPMRTLVFYGLGSYEWRGSIHRFSDVAFTWSSLTPDGQLTLDQNEYFWPEGAGEVLDLAAEANVGRYLAVVAVDRDDRLTKLVLEETARERLAAQIAEVLAEYRLDGVVLDLEGLGFGKQDDELIRVRQGYVELVATVADRLHPREQEVVAAVMPPNGWYPGYDYKAIAAVADQVLVMAYPYGGDQPEPLEQVEEAIVMSLAEMAPQRILLGLLVEHETPESIMQKVSLAKRHNLAGIAVWILRSLDQAELEAIESQVSPLR